MRTASFTTTDLWHLVSKHAQDPERDVFYRLISFSDYTLAKAFVGAFVNHNSSTYRWEMKAEYRPILDGLPSYTEEHSPQPNYYFPDGSSLRFSDYGHKPYVFSAP